MSRLACLSLLILLLALLAGCAAPGIQTVPTAALETPAGETSPEAHELPATVLPTQPPVETEPPAPTAAATLEPSLEPSASPSAEPGLAWIAFTGMDGNIWLVDAAGREQRRVTQDAVPYKVGEPQPEREVTYSNPVWSTDGRMLAFRQQIGVAVETGYEYTFALFVHDLETGETRTLVEGETVGSFAWKPGEAVLAYGAPIDFDYFQRGAPNSDLARGLQAVDAASGETFELVKPERGFHLINPRWSQDGRFVAFEEVQYIEGRGLVAIYDFEVQEYIPWERAIGNFDWAPDGEALAYDTLNYAPTGSERIYRSDRRGQNEQPVSPDYEPGYAFEPVFAPAGDRIAYLAELGEMPDTHYEIFILDLAGGEPVSLGVVDQPLYLAWMPGSQNLVLSMGPWDQSQVALLPAAGGAPVTLAEGNQPAPQPAVITE